MGWAQIRAQCKPLKDSEEVLYSTGCMKKVRYPTEEDAILACTAMERKYNFNFNHYNCKFCDAYHVGRYNERSA